jgi:hypothetical protein
MDFEHQQAEREFIRVDIMLGTKDLDTPAMVEVAYREGDSFDVAVHFTGHFAHEDYLTRAISVLRGRGWHLAGEVSMQVPSGGFVKGTARFVVSKRPAPSAQ